MGEAGGENRVREGMPQQIVRHIGFAERWLARARQECAQGNVPRSLLTLLLAEAEVHRARLLPREAVATAPAATPRAPLMTAAVALVAAGALLLAQGRVAQPASEPPPAPLILTLGHQVGRVLALVALSDDAGTAQAAAPSGVRVAPAVPAPVRLTRPPAVVTTQRTARPARNPVGTASPSVRPRARDGGSTEASRPVLTEGDLIDLVLAAERSLRMGGR
ncbi:MAG: hypothetical protein QN122_08485 [Armatimonadota bacterium]|nr:hypothetical protein [Armatimonadota bacterium]MDR7449225.1 hypothetical protein [Armatimonadota bacterium]MDR7459290.1 hypothetical protein [Armatimonadota bacterium]MDR7478338.1 hypothetical protein [Armatimonadota bacterium]MDR7487219.1 hypothetical protein [Armatimonadota bacterium]